MLKPSRSCASVNDRGDPSSCFAEPSSAGADPALPARAAGPIAEGLTAATPYAHGGGPDVGDCALTRPIATSAMNATRTVDRAKAAITIPSGAPMLGHASWRSRVAARRTRPRD